MATFPVKRCYNAITRFTVNETKIKSDTKLGELHLSDMPYILCIFSNGAV